MFCRGDAQFFFTRFFPLFCEPTLTAFALQKYRKLSGGKPQQFFFAVRTRVNDPALRNWKVGQCCSIVPFQFLLFFLLSFANFPTHFVQALGAVVFTSLLMMVTDAAPNNGGPIFGTPYLYKEFNYPVDPNRAAQLAPAFQQKYGPLGANLVAYFGTGNLRSYEVPY